MNDTSLILDCGANAESRPEYLLQYGIMGSIFVEKVKGIENPEVMLLNVGAEEEKGDPLHKESFELLRNADINFKGNCEGRDVPFGCCDVVVTDGFSGNVFLKSSEGVALAVMKRIKQKMTEGLAAKAGALLSYNKLKEIKKEFDYSEEGGAPILGLKGPVLKIHGSSKANAVYNAILKAVPYVEQDVTALIENAITENLRERNRMKDYSVLERNLGYSFQDKKLLAHALTHSSYASEHDLAYSENNERLEFIGDAYLDAIIGKQAVRGNAESAGRGPFQDPR